MRFFVKTQARQNFGGAGGRGMGHDIGEAHMNFRYAVRVLRGFGFFQQGAALGIGGKHEIDQLAVASRRLLLDRTDARAARRLNGSALGGDLAADQAEQSGLAGAVAPDEADLGALGQRQAGGIEQKTRPKPVGEIGDREHGSTGEETFSS